MVVHNVFRLSSPPPLPLHLSSFLPHRLHPPPQHPPLHLTLTLLSTSPSPSSPSHLHPPLHLAFTLLSNSPSPSSPPHLLSISIPTTITNLPLLSPFLPLPSQVRVTQFTILVVSLSSTTTPTGGNTVARTLQYGRRGDCECIVTITIKPATLTPEWGEHFEL